jgi:hypothetical protein
MTRKEIFCQLFRFSAYRKYFFVLLLLSVELIANSQDTTLTVISNLKGAPANMTMIELRSVLKAERQRWEDHDHTKVNIVMMNTTTSIGRNTCLKIYHMDPNAVAKFWLRLGFDHIAIVKTFNSVAELEKFIAENPGTIGVTGKFSDTHDIKVTMIDGKKSF